jgi:uncharacterized membrane protein YkvI
MTPNRWQRYFLPGFTFMAVVIGGGYATGRELVEFFMSSGPVGGLLGMCLTALVWSIVLAVTLDVARSTSSYEYRRFFSQILGRGWIIFELVYLAILVLVLAVLGAAAGEIAHHALGVPLWLGTLVLVSLITILVAFGSSLVETLFSVWGVILYLTFATFLFTSLAVFREAIEARMALDALVSPGWVRGGLAYAGYNLAIAPVLLFVARHQTRRRESLIAGALAGPIAIVPGMLFYVAMLARYPEIRDVSVPVQYLLAALEIPWLASMTQIVLFGTLVKTGVGIVHGFNERLVAPRAAASPQVIRAIRIAVPVVMSSFSILLAARVGLIDLIAKGYGFLAWVIIAIYVIPVLAVGLPRLFSSPQEVLAR